MPNVEVWLEKIDYLKDELTDIRMVLDELLHVLRHIKRNGLGVYDADAHWRAEGSSQPTVCVARELSVNEPKDIDTENEEDDADEGQSTSPSALPIRRAQTGLFD